MFDLSYLTSTPEAVAILWHGVLSGAPFLLIAVLGWWRTRRKSSTPEESTVAAAVRLQDQLIRHREATDALRDLVHWYGRQKPGDNQTPPTFMLERVVEAERGLDQSPETALVTAM